MSEPADGPLVDASRTGIVSGLDAGVLRVDAPSPEVGPRLALLGPEPFTHAQLWERAAAIAAHLHDMGIRHGDRVALHLFRGPNHVAAVLAALRLGAAYVPVDPDQPPARIAAILRDSAPAAIIGTTALLADLPRYLLRAPMMRGAGHQVRHD